MSGHGWVTPNNYGARARCGGPGVCSTCNQEAATAGFRGETGQGASPVTTVRCPGCGHEFAPGEDSARRATESVRTSRSTRAGMEVAGPGSLQGARFRLDTEDGVRAAWEALGQADAVTDATPAQLRQALVRTKAAMLRMGMVVSENSTTEAMINGLRSWDEIRELIRKALRARVTSESGVDYCWVSIVDVSDADVVYTADFESLYQCGYAVADDGTVTLGQPTEVVRTYAPAPVTASDVDLLVAESAGTPQRHQILGRVVEAKGTGSDGGRIFRVRIIAYGDSKNARRYPETVLRAAASLYEGAKAYDHHRDDAELNSGTVVGMVGMYRNVEATGDGLEADLHLLPSATHAAEVLDAALTAQEDGLDPPAGISHDVFATFKAVSENGRRLHEATEITKVNSADIVSDPAAGGQATRMVAGGVTTTQTDPAGATPAGQSTKESDVTTTTADVLAALKTATPEELAAVGLSKASESVQTPPTGTAPVAATETTLHAKDSFLGKLMVSQKVNDAGLPTAVVESVTASLPDRFGESEVDAQIAGLKAGLAIAERAGLAPSIATVQVTQESRDKKRAALDAFFAADYSNGYRSFKEAFVDFTGIRPRAFDEDFNRTVLQESFGTGFYSGTGKREKESMDSTTWNLVLGDSITRRMVAEYGRPSLQTWRKIVSAIVPVNDFRSQKIERIGGYGTLPVVNQGAPYQPLTSPGNEEASYTITKKGGTEDITLEMIANDDARAIQRIPSKLGLAAAQTLYRFVWDVLPTNAATSYDSTALFHANHANTDATAVLGQSTLSAGRKKMRKQTAYGDTSDVLSIVPAFLIVPSDLEEIAVQLCTSAVAIPSTPAGASNTPNIHQGLEPIVIDYYTDANDWYLAADPMLCPTIEIGFYQGREDPELFTQADNSTGSVFNADKITFKIRHIYSGATLEHRGLYRATN